MNKTDRLLAIVLELQAHGTRRAEDLAATFEVSRRTIYRDIDALCAAGVPLVGEAGRGYSLPPGYFLPPLRFTADEAAMLLLGADAIAPQFDAEYRAAAESAARKIAGSLPPERRESVQLLRAGLQVIAPPRASPYLPPLRRAVARCQCVSLTYRSRAGQSATRRTVEPHALVLAAGLWVLSGWCQLRQDFRNFRLDRIEALDLLPEHFSRRPDFVLAPDDAERTVRVRVLLTPAAARRLVEEPLYYQTAAAPGPDGTLVTLMVRHETDLLSWVLSFGAQARVLEPETLAARIRDEVKRLLT